MKARIAGLLAIAFVAVGAFSADTLHAKGKGASNATVAGGVCAHKETGALRLAVDGNGCSNSEISVDLGGGMPGPEGPMGPAGPEGPMGPAGPEGPMGPMGPAGPQGSEGPMGPAGPQGSEGPMGPAGPEGPMGPKGDTGDTGATGPAGPQGSPGVSGVQVVTASSAPGSNPNAIVSAICPIGKVAIGGGAAIVGGNGSVALNQNQPFMSGGSAVGWIGSGIEVVDYANNWWVTAHAICAFVS